MSFLGAIGKIGSAIKGGAQKAGDIGGKIQAGSKAVGQAAQDVRDVLHDDYNEYQKEASAPSPGADAKNRDTLILVGIVAVIVLVTVFAAKAK